MEPTTNEEKIAAARPAVSRPDASAADTDDTFSSIVYCSKCGKRGTSASINKCARCKTALYCSTDCQKAAWPEHKHECVAHGGKTWAR